VVELALQINQAESLIFSGLQAYHGAAQHIRDFARRRAAVAAAVEQVDETLHMLAAGAFKNFLCSRGLIRN
jgi:3-hydroxy-D-aspartate aldolase